MSANGRALRCAVPPAVISGSLFGSGTLAIPVGVVSVTVAGAGAPGGNDYVYHPGQPYIADVAWTAGQPYIAPWETGGPYTGSSTTATLNGVTKTWLGGYYVTAPVSATYALVSTGAGQSLTYSVPAGGQLSYEYAF